MRKFIYVLMVAVLVGMVVIIKIWSNPQSVSRRVMLVDQSFRVNISRVNSSRVYHESCCQIAAENNLEVLCLNKSNVASNCSCTDYMMCKLVMVTAISSNHYPESQDYFGSIHKNMPNTTIIVYDLGLKENEIATLQSYCNVEVRKLNLLKYPSHAKNLQFYAWKPIIIKEMSLEYELFMYCDSSCRVKKSLNSYLPHMMVFPFLSVSLLHYPMVVTTHEGMLKYLNITLKRTELAKFHSTQGVYIFWATEKMKKKLLSPLIDCALHKECIAPDGATLFGCNFKDNSNGKYVGCHRYDQSALNMILIREFGAEWSAVYDRENSYAGATFVVDRKATKLYAKNICITSM